MDRRNESPKFHEFAITDDNQLILKSDNNEMFDELHFAVFPSMVRENKTYHSSLLIIVFFQQVDNNREPPKLDGQCMRGTRRFS